MCDGVGPDAFDTLRHGTAGNVQVVVRRGGRALTPGLGDFHPEIANPADTRPDDAGCAELITAVPQILFTNLTTAAAMLNTWRLFATGELGYSELVFDVRLGRMAPLIESDQLSKPPDRKGAGPTGSRLLKPLNASGVRTSR